MKTGDNGDKGKNEAKVADLEKFIHDQTSEDNAFRTSEQFNAIKILMTSEQLIEDNAMRYDIPSNAMILGVALSIQRCHDHDYQGGVEFWKLVLALMTSKKGKRTSQFVDAIIGEQRWKAGITQNQNLSFFQKAKQMVQGGG